MTLRTLTLSTALCFATVTAASAQAVDPAKSFDAMLTGFEQECMSAAKAMPAEKYSFSPASLNIPGANYTGVRTFVQEVTHIAEANYYYASQVGGMKPEADLKAIDKITNKEEALKALTDSFAFSHKAFATLTPANAWEPLKMMPSATRASVAGGEVAHGFDHYGQMVEYLRINGIVPPASAK